MLTFLVIRLCDKHDIALAMLPVLVSGPMADMSVITSGLCTWCTASLLSWFDISAVCSHIYAQLQQLEHFLL